MWREMLGSAVLDPKSGLYLRSDSDGEIGDNHVIKEQNLYRPLPISKDDIVLDVGAHIGAFIRLVALPKSPKCSIAVEPDPESFAVLRLNVEGIPSVKL